MHLEDFQCKSSACLSVHILARFPATFSCSNYAFYEVKPVLRSTCYGQYMNHAASEEHSNVVVHP